MLIRNVLSGAVDRMGVLRERTWSFQENCKCDTTSVNKMLGELNF